MPQFLVPSTDVLVFTDYHFCAGGITDGSAPAAALSQGAVLLLRDIFFPSDPAGADAAPVADRVASRFTELGGEEAEAVGASFARDIPYLSVVDQAPDIGGIQVEDFAESGTLELASTTTFRPAGRLYRRTVGPARVAFSVASESLSGIVRPDPTLLAMGMDDNGIHTILQTTEGSGCGACGVCGACVVCAEINYAVAGVAAFALVALQNEVKQKAILFEAAVPEPAAQQSAGRIPREELTTAVRNRVRPLLDLPEILSGQQTQDQAEQGKSS